MSVYSIIFSPTGGTEKVMSLLTSAWENVKTIDLSQPQTDYSQYSFTGSDICLFGVPAYEGRVPKLALKRLSQMHGRKTPSMLVAVFGNRDFNDTLLELKNTLVPLGFAPYAAVSAVARHSVLVPVAEGRPDEADAAELREFSIRLKAAAEKEGPCPAVTVPGKEPYLVVNIPKIYPSFDGQKCTRCMICADLCPALAIDRADLARIDRNLCACCMRCVSVCPTSSRFIDSEQKNAIMGRLSHRLTGRKPNTLYLG